MVVRAVTASPTGEVVVSSPMIPGPFLVVGVQIGGRSVGDSSILVTVTGAPARFVGGAGERLSPHGAVLSPQGPPQLLLGIPTIGYVDQLSRPIRLWPWYVFTGDVGAVALWVRGHGGLFAKDVSVLVSVWSLEDALRPEANGGSHDGHHRPSSAAWRAGGGSRGGVRAPLAFAARRS